MIGARRFFAFIEYVNKKKDKGDECEWATEDNREAD